MPQEIDLPDDIGCPSPEDMNLPEREYRFWHDSKVIMDDLDNYIGIGEMEGETIFCKKQFTGNQRKKLNDLRPYHPEMYPKMIEYVLLNTPPDEFPFGL